MNPAEFKKLYLLELQKIESRQEGPDETTKHILNFIETVTENYSSDEIKEIVKEMPELAEGYIARLKQHLVRCAGNEGFIHYTTLIRFTSAAEQGTLAKTLGLNLMQDPILLQRTLTSHEAATNFYKEYNTTHPLPPTQYPSQLLEKGLYDYWNEEQKKQGKIHIALDHINGISLTSPIEPLQFIKTFETNQAKNRSQQNLKNKRLELQMTDPTGPNLRAQLSLCRSQQQYQHTRLYFIVNHIINTRRLVAQLKELEETAQRNQKDIEKLLEKLPQLLSELETKKQEYQERSKKLQDIAQQIKEKEMLELEVLRLCEKQEKELLRTLSLHPKISSETTSETANLTQDPRSSSSFTTQSLPHQASHNTQQEAYPQKFENKLKNKKRIQHQN
ncbi:MAG: hypothetical protein A3I12_07240 [Gammaproteobacteria bacterium RIFCSPLOWO2_02_FULL_38_11]|nr:MAG: hypothetical protein A3I12_07240 [Gammaproteobacteria bacterium RIFCSPLOWO2_02_FULL_38_11]